jgi:elongation factor P
MASIRATELRKGNVIVGQNGELLVITDYQHRTPGNLRAVIHMKVKNLATGQVSAMRPASGESFEHAFLERRKAEYLYRDGSGNYFFMDSETYEQFPLSEELVGDKMLYVRENETVEITFHEKVPVGVELPSQVVLTVTEAEPAVKGNTANNVKKDAVTETGLKIKVPLHIAPGDRVKISTADGEFQGREN